MTKTVTGNFFEDFQLGQVIRHATPRTVTAGDVALYTALYGSRFAVQSSAEFARAIGYPAAPVDDLLVFHIVFGKSVPDISLNAVANLGYAECQFITPVFPGDTVSATSEVIGLRQTSAGDSGVVWVRTEGINQHGRPVLRYVRWVMVRKRDPSAAAPETVVPKLADRVEPTALGAAVPSLAPGGYDYVAAGSAHRLGDYVPGERIDHADGFTIEEAEHQLATRLYQNTAKVHFNNHVESKGRFGRRLVYGGVIMSIARALSFNGLANAFHIAAINAGKHAAPAFAGDTIYAWSEVIERTELTGRSDVGALRVRTTALKDIAGGAFLREEQPGNPAGGVVLDLDVWLLVPR
jgi:2-methylfumaryl-CoA hydratase